MKLPIRAEMIDHLTIILEDRNNQAHWRVKAACRGMETAFFFPPVGAHTQSQQAKAVCAACPVKAECLQALGRYSGGIVGGQTTSERTKGHMIKKNLDLLQLRDHIIRTEPLEIAAHDLGLSPLSVQRHIHRHPQGVST